MIGKQLRINTPIGGCNGKIVGESS